MSGGKEYEDLKKLSAKELDKLLKDGSEELHVHVTKIPEQCDHDWDNDGCNPEYCLKCGMSFTRYIFTECP